MMLTALLGVTAYALIVTALLVLAIGGNSDLHKQLQKARRAHADLAAKLYGRP